MKADRPTQAGTGTDRSATGGAQAIRRAIEIVRLVAQIQTSGASLSRVARASGLKTSTTFRILRSLTEERLLRYAEDDRCYFVGPLAFELGLAVTTEADARLSWRDAVDRIAGETRLTTYLMARSDKDAVCLLCVQGSTALRAMPVEVGQRLDLTRQRGFAVSSGTVAAGVVGVGVAILPQQGVAQLALSVSAVANSIDPREARKIASIIAAAIHSHHPSNRNARVGGTQLGSGRDGKLALR